MSGPSVVSSASRSRSSTPTPSTASSRRSSAMAETRVRIEIAFDGGQVLAAFVPAEAADDLERALGQGNDAAFALEAEDGRYTVSLRRVVYVKRFTREARVGFTPA